MSITQALYTGVTGLGAMSDGMSVVANNIANANAKGFKYDRAEFADLLSQDLTSGTGNAQLGRGARLSTVRSIHTQGGLAVTDRLTDLAIQGSGFFMVNNKIGEKQEAGGNFFTRTGTFNFDKDGYLSDQYGGRLQGYMADTDGILSSRLTDIHLVTNTLPPKQTDVVQMTINLDARTPVSPEEFDINNPSKTSDFANTVNVFDSQGNRHALTTFFKRIEDSDGVSFEWHACVDGVDVTDADGAKYKEAAKGVVRFDNKGMLLSEEMGEASVNFTKGAVPGQAIKLDFGKNIRDEGGNGVGASTATASQNDTIAHVQNGYQAGNIKTIKFDLDGKIKGYYTNGVERVLGGIALATFENTDGLMKAGRNQFYATNDSGEPRVGLAQTGTRGSIYGSSLEESNVDLASQFVNMIVTQRGFQANSRSITTTDSLIEEVVNMKR
jgi:flagellar hook protein FlgE